MHLFDLDILIIFALLNNSSMRQFGENTKRMK